LVAPERHTARDQGKPSSQEYFDLLTASQPTIAPQRRHVMYAFVTAILITLSIGSTALAQQQRNVRDMMNDMKAKYGQTFEQCQALATSRGYRLTDDEYEGRSVMMFIEGCIMGKQS
jgi:hypothetical protein